MRVDAPCWWKNRCKRVLFTAGFASAVGHDRIQLRLTRSRSLEDQKSSWSSTRRDRSFDHLYGLFPGANGLSNATREQTLQRDHDGSELPYLTVWDNHGKPHPSHPRLPNAPFRIDAEPVSMGADQVPLEPHPRLLPQHRADQRRP